MTTITPINLGTVDDDGTGDTLKAAGTKVNANEAALNAGKIETSVLDTDGALTANSDAKIATQKATKTYADTKLALTGGTLTGTLTINASGIIISNTGVGQLAIFGESTTQNSATRHSANSTGPLYNLRKGRGTIASPSAAVLNDECGKFRFDAYTGAGYTQGGVLQVNIIEPTPSATALGQQMVWFLPPLGSATATEVFRLEADTGISMGGANPVISSNRHHILRSYTVATLPGSATAGALARVTDAVAATFGAAPTGGGAVVVGVMWNGSAWVMS